MDIHKLPVVTCNTVVVGSGAAALNAADRLVSFGQNDVVIVTEGMNMGTSRNTGSDKQTYYKLTLSGSEPDDPPHGQDTLRRRRHGRYRLGGSTLSAQAFYHLVDISTIPIIRMVICRLQNRPRSQTAGYIRRALTSRYMTEAQAQVA